MNRAELSGAWRALRRSPGFATVSILSLVLGIGLNTTLLSVIEAALLRPLPYGEAEGLVVVQDARMTGEGHFLSAQEFERYAAASRTLAPVGAYRAGMADRYALRVETPAGPATGYEVSANMFAILRVPPSEGRLFADGDAASGAQPVIIGQRLRERLFAPGQPALGATLRIRGVPHTIVGVMPRGFWFPFEEGTFWIPLRDAGGGSGEERALSLVGRMARGATREAAASEAEVLVRRMDEAAATRAESRWARTASLDEARRPSDRNFFLVLQAVVLAILLIACSNVAGLALVRVTGRRRDTAIRAAVGGSRWQLLQPLLAENLLVAAAALVAGVGASLLLLRGVLATLPASTPLRELVDVSPNPRLLAVALALAAVSLLLCTVLPALQATRADLGLVLKEDGGNSGRRTSATRVRGLVVVLQIAISVVLLVCSGVLLDYVARANAWDPGYVSEGLLTMPLQVDELPERGRRLAHVAGAVVQELSGQPAVNAVAVETRFIPAGGQVSAVAAERGAVCRCVEVSQGFLRALGIPLVRGRDFAGADRAATGLAVIDQRLAASLWPDADPLGASLRLGSPGSASATVTVVGIARATDFSRPRSDGLLPATPGVYVLSAFDSAAAGTLFVRARGGYAAVAAAVAAAAPGQEVRRLRPVAAMLRAEQDPLRWYARLFGGFAALGLGLAMIGLYGVVGYGTIQRRREFAIRAALGASPRHVVPLVLGQGIWLVGWGTALGALGAFAAVQVIASLLHGASALSLPTLAGIAAILLVVVLCAYLLPLRQAMGTDPAEAMRAA